MAGKKMVMVCSAFGLFRDDMKFEGESAEAILRQAKKHAYEVHGMSKKALSDPKLLEIVKEKAKTLPEKAAKKKK